MNTVRLDYTVTLSDFREASYYMLFLRKRKAFRIAAAVVAAFFIYAVLCVNKVATMEPIAAFFAIAYMIWFLLQLAQEERQILKYAKTPDTLIGVSYHAEFDETQFSFAIPDRNFSVSGDISQLVRAFEITHSFLLYATGQQLFIIPTRNMRAQEAFALRKILKNVLGDRFASLFAWKKQPKD